MRKPRVLDLFCRAGGASMGYHRAGFEVVGVDIEPQPDYPFSFYQADAMTYPFTEYPFNGFDFIHASPPCQGYSWSAKRWDHGKALAPKLIPAVRARLIASGIPYVIENVVGAPLENPIVLCGEMFGLKVLRHRLFESSLPLISPKHVKHKPPVIRQAKDGTDRMVQRSYYCTVAGHGGESDDFTLEGWRVAMGIDWMQKSDLVEAIPPAYSEYIGRQVIALLQLAEAAA